MHWQVWDARPDERLGDTPPRQVHQQVRVVTPIEIRVLLRPHHADAGNRLAVDEKFFMLLVPAIDRFGSLIHAAVFVVGADVMPPGLQAAGDAVEHPHPRLGRRFAGQPERGPSRLIQGHALGDQLVPAEQAVDEFARLAVVLKARCVTARLMVEHDDVRTTADFLAVAEALALAADGAAVHPGPDAIRPARRLRGAVIQVPDFQPAVVVPANPLAISQIVPIRLTRDVLAAALAEFPPAILTVADSAAAQPAPTVVREALRVVAFGDFTQDGWDKIIVGGAGGTR